MALDENAVKSDIKKVFHTPEKILFNEDDIYFKPSYTARHREVTLLAHFSLFICAWMRSRIDRAMDGATIKPSNTTSFQVIKHKGSPFSLVLHKQKS